MTQQEHLNHIRARCVELLEIAEKRTPGTWDSGRNWVGSDHACVATTHHYSHKSDATFIASCAEAAEAGWKATIAAIDGIEEMDESTHIYNFITSNIIASWPAELF